MLGSTVKIILVLFLTVIVAASTVTAAMQNITANDVQKIKKTSDIYLLDVRTLGEFAQKRIKGAHLIPIDQVQTRIKEIPKDRHIVVYCETGVRSAMVGRYLDSLGYKNVSNLAQGIMGWQLRGYPIESGMP